MKKTSKLLCLIAIILGNLVGSTPFEDEKGHPAPNVVRKAADNTISAMNVYLGHEAGKVKVPCTDFPFICGLPCCQMCCPSLDPGCFLCPCCMTGPVNVWLVIASRPLDYDKGELYWWSDESTKPNRTIALENIKARVSELKEHINNNVQKPIPYANDVNLPWKFNMWTDGKMRLQEPLETVVQRWVNSHGGWKESTTNPLVVSYIMER